MRHFNKTIVAALTAAAFLPGAALAQGTVKIGMVTFLSGPAAAPFGVPAKNAAEMVVEHLNKGSAPAPYATKGFGGAALETVIIDEAGSSTTQVTEFRNLIQRSKVDVVIGYVSSGNCLAIAPVAEELKALTNFFDCGTPRIFEDGSYKYVFRTSPTATMDNVGAALYIKDIKPGLKSIAGINQNYAWGQDSWADFEATIKHLFPGVAVKTSQMPKLFAGQYNTEISTLLGEKPDVIHSSFFDGDLEALLLQGAPRNLFKGSIGVLTTGETAMHKLAAQIPDGTLLGARGPFGPYAPDNALNKWFLKEYVAKYKDQPNYAVLPDDAGDPRRKDRLGKGAGGQRRQASLDRPGRGGLRKAQVRRSRRHGRHGQRQGPPGRDGNRLRHDQDGEGQDHGHQREALPGRQGQPARRRQGCRLDQGRLQVTVRTAAAAAPAGRPL